MLATVYIKFEFVVLLLSIAVIRTTELTTWSNACNYTTDCTDQGLLFPEKCDMHLSLLSG